MAILSEISGSNISIVSKGSSEETKNHRYFTRSSARKYRSPLSINNKEPIVYLTPLKNFDNSCGDIHLQLQQYELCESNSQKVNFPNSKSVKPMEECRDTRTFKILKFGVFIGMVGLLVTNFIEHYIVQNDRMTDIKHDLEDLKKNFSNLDEKISKLIENGSKNAIAEIQRSFANQNKLIQNNIPSLEHIKQLVKDALSQYDADKTGLTDFALESSGGSIVTIRNTENYVSGAPMLTLFGIPLCSGSNSPRTIIQPSTLPGECWAFKGCSGTAVIKLLGKVIINGVSLEHIPASISPTGELKTAPKEFSIWGLSSETSEGTFLGQFIYNITGSAVQYFSINSCYKAYNMVEFRVHSNHGHPEYTCVYRLRVHGKLDGQT